MISQSRAVRNASLMATDRRPLPWELSVLGRTQREIATELGISQPAVSKILRRETDHRPATKRLSAVQKLTSALN